MSGEVSGKLRRAVTLMGLLSALIMGASAGMPNASWRYAITRRSVVALEARLDDRLVWSAPSNGGARTAPWFQSSLGNPQ